MFIRKTVVAVALAAAALPAAFANSGSTYINGEVGFQEHPVQGTASRAEVKKELEAFRKNPVTADGGRIINGEIGYVPPQHSYAFEGGKLVHTDKLAHNTPKPSQVMTPAERRTYRQNYFN